MKLTAKQRLFADEYIKSGNAMQSAIKAGYSEKYAKARSAQMLENVGIKSYIDAKMAEIESRKIADAKEVLQFYTRVLREEETEEVALPAGDDVVTVEKKPSMKDRLSAAKELMKRYPFNDPVVQTQLRKLNAEADLTEEKVKAAKQMTGDDNKKLGEILDKIEEGVVDGPSKTADK
ncbi:terminase small subunit [Limosilactobacillus reuteri]|jgi:phage terminase small subunit|uniref:terminase small subunit n=1 Tax=Lactobacillaceae TaxID=33958 RepID=UPI000BEF0037|nr:MULTISPECIES: terminase small subunit [Lactobacillaceae]PEH08683.1 hypothetical protein CP354_02165 [Lactobacillus sp. UMNPBX3]MBC6910150.1 terminase small subunit [Limosilactobacillus reuteri]MCC4346483.1 terminase small subunit [Limosilactobacillus reuteri]MCI1977858.1 terminase small subunit [Liquorilactobacillus nagelii]MEE1989252.1 terminase small subunit [Limosilactobacillus reuteri]